MIFTNPSHPSLLLHTTTTPKITPNTATQPPTLALIGTGVSTGTNCAFNRKIARILN